MSRFSLQWVIQKHDEGKLVKEFLKEHEISKAALTDIKFSGGKISLNGKDITVRKPLTNGDKLIVEFPAESISETMLGENIPLEKIYEDEYLLVINKPAGMSTIPSREHPTGSLANALLGYYEKVNLATTIHIVTRLDKDTSGIVLVAKHRHIHHLFSKQQQEGKVKREYEALAHGRFEITKGTIEQPIGRRKESIIEREVRDDGQYACTHYTVIDQNSSFAHVRLQLETGRTHQIRVHLSYMGHPLLGDDLYGGALDLINRQALHCCKLSFVHPISKETLIFELPIPYDMKQVLEDFNS